jgi:pyruvate dehydrogenase E1 component alpha subunit
MCGLSDDEVKKIDEWATQVVADAVKFAEESPAPEPQELFTDVVAEHGPRPVAEEETE